MLASTLIREARRAGLPADSLTPVGSLRRFAPDIGDVSLLGVAPLSRHRQAARRVRATSRRHRRPRPRSRVDDGADRARARSTLLLAVPEHAGSALVWHTGSRAHVAQLQAAG